MDRFAIDFLPYNGFSAAVHKFRNGYFVDDSDYKEDDRGNKHFFAQKEAA